MGFRTRARRLFELSNSVKQDLLRITRNSPASLYSKIREREKEVVTQTALYLNVQLGVLLTFLPYWVGFAIANNYETLGKPKKAAKFFAFSLLLNLVPFVLLFHGFYTNLITWIIIAILVAWTLNVGLVFKHLRELEVLSEKGVHLSQHKMKHFIGLVAFGVIIGFLYFIGAGVLYLSFNSFYK